ncbi:hypothetical protein Nepgr_010722 [Nepenthes gracilis]|uniref:Uncharacterized protein n=1 Tax=Nepenthes gracilis TaxID=150966 RepID=A0AAD3SDZ3_NEPGR|nr:hypothetical protein Nepgr_010722 [Nepenthes gracilis]
MKNSKYFSADLVKNRNSTASLSEVDKLVSEGFGQRTFYLDDLLWVSRIQEDSVDGFFRLDLLQRRFVHEIQFFHVLRKKILSDLEQIARPFDSLVSEDLRNPIWRPESLLVFAPPFPLHFPRREAFHLDELLCIVRFFDHDISSGYILSLLEHPRTFMHDVLKEVISFQCGQESSQLDPISQLRDLPCLGYEVG